MINLRPYQLNLVNGLRQSMLNGNQKVILCAPTGGGKTVMFSYMVSQSAKRGKKCLILTHRTELLTQSGGKLKHFNIKIKTIEANKEADFDSQVNVAMVETLNIRVKKHPQYQVYLKTVDLIIIDEAHLQDFNKIFPYISDHTFVIGATATPFRRGKSQKSLDEFYEDMIQEVDVSDLIEMGYLSKARTFGVNMDMKEAKKKGDDYDMTEIYDKNKVYEGVVENYKRLILNKKTLIFCSSVKASKQLAKEFNWQGYEARHLDGTSTNRKETLEWFHKTPNAILVNCSILTAGFDQPDIDAVILYRATTSLPLFLQMCGRGSRVTEKKKEFFILDFGNNIHRFGFWQDARNWSLKKDEKKIKKTGEMAVRNCPSCGAMLPATLKVCSECGHKFKIADFDNEKDVVQLLELEYCKNQIRKVSELKPVELYLLMKKKKEKASYIFRVARSQGSQFLWEFIKYAKYSDAWYYRQIKQPKGFNDKTVIL